LNDENAPSFVEVNEDISMLSATARQTRLCRFQRCTDRA